MVRKLEDWYYYSMATFLAVLLVFLVAVLPGRADIHTGPERIAPYEQTETERGCRYQIRLGKRDSEGQSIAFLTEHQLLRVYADSALIYSVGESDSLVFGRTPGKRWNFVELSAGVQTIVVETEDLYGVSYNSIPDFFFGIRSEIEEELMRESFTKATISIFLMIAGLFLILMWLLIGRKTAANRSLIFLGMIALCLGAWFLNECDIARLLFHQRGLAAFVLYALWENVRRTKRCSSEGTTS